MLDCTFFLLFIYFNFRELPSPCKNHSLIDDSTCDMVNYNEECKFDGKDCCPNPTAIGNGYCNSENLIKMCNFDGGDCCELDKVGDGTCDEGNLNRLCDFHGELKDCSCDYKNLTRDGYCNVANNKSNCLFDDLDCSCPNSTLIDNGVSDRDIVNLAGCNFDGYDCACGGSTSDYSCCSSTNPCKAGWGDCDSDSDCVIGTTCGVNNCGPAFPSYFYCCESVDESNSNFEGMYLFVTIFM